MEKAAAQEAGVRGHTVCAGFSRLLLAELGGQLHRSRAQSSRFSYIEERSNQ